MWAGPCAERALMASYPSPVLPLEMDQIDVAGMIFEGSELTASDKDYFVFEIGDIRHCKVDHDGGGRIRVECFKWV